MRRDIHGLFEDIHEAAGFIADDTAGLSFDEFEQDRRVRQVVERNFEFIGEAVNRLRQHDPSLVDQISAYRQFVSFCNALIHGYDVIDYAVVRHAVHESLPVLRTEIDQLLRESEQPSEPIKE